MGKLDQDQLCRLLGDWGKSQRADVTIVFDGPAPALAIQQRLRAMGVAVRFSARRSADDLIVEQIEHDPLPTACTVVSSDHAIQHAARYRRAVSVGATPFLQEVLRPPSESPAQDATARSDDTEKPDTVSPEEAETWLERFGHDIGDSLEDGELPS